jgi:hypothetical protein
VRHDLFTGGVGGTGSQGRRVAPNQWLDQ